jgi:hypothetical protein
MKRRYNIFNQAHKALRGLLYDTALVLQLTDFSIPEEACPALEKIEVALSILDHHARNEERFLLEVIRMHDPVSYSFFIEQQAKEESLNHLLKNQIDGYYTSVIPDQQEDNGLLIFDTFNNYLSLQLAHMSTQETAFNMILWSRLTDQDLCRLNNYIILSTPAEIRLIASNWMLRCTSNKELFLWIVEVKDHAPEFVFQSLLELAEKVLPEVRWKKIREGLTEGIMVA